MTHKEIEETLEAMVDAQSVVAVLTALVNICHEKADHVATNWQDKNLAKVWTQAGKHIDKMMHNNRYEWP